MMREGGRPLPQAHRKLIRIAIASAMAAAIHHGMACAPRPPATDPGEGASAERFIVEAVSRERTHVTVGALTAFGPRMGGTASGAMASGWIRDRLAETGLAVESVEDPETEFHEAISSETAILSPEPGVLTAWPVGFSPSRPPVEAEIRLEPPPTPTGEPVRWALLTGLPPAAAFDSAVQRGAVALLSDHPREEGRFLDWAPSEEFPEGKRGILPGWTLPLREGSKIRAWLSEGRTVKARLGIESTTGRASPRTIVATLPGTIPGWYLVCAHLDSDSGGPGADDNASGAASLLEVARALSAASKAGRLPAKRPAVVFAFWGKEIHSTKAFLGSRAEMIPALLGVFNFDQTGTGTVRDALYFEGNDVPWNGPILKALMSVAGDLAGTNGFPKEYTTTPSLGDTDTHVFLPARFKGAGVAPDGIPATTVFTAAWGKPLEIRQSPGWESKGWSDRFRVFVDYSRYYHSSGDRPGVTTALRPDNMARCARAVALAIYRLMAGTAAGTNSEVSAEEMPHRQAGFSQVNPPARRANR